MARLKRFCPVGIAQHVIQRGNNRQVCFGLLDQGVRLMGSWILDLGSWIMDQGVRLMMGSWDQGVRLLDLKAIK